jgi:hypothetical protein
MNGRKFRWGTRHSSAPDPGTREIARGSEDQPPTRRLNAIVSHTDGTPGHHHDIDAPDA